MAIRSRPDRINQHLLWHPNSVRAVFLFSGLPHLFAHRAIQFRLGVSPQ